MIDIHCHILPGIDDGPARIEESIEMCRMAEADRITTVVATPHLKPGIFEANRVQERIQELQSALDCEGIAVRILPGADVSVTPELPAYIDKRIAFTINGTGKYFLAELPQNAMPNQWDQFLLSFRRKGIVPIITHPERNRWFLSHPDAIMNFVLAGGLVQITAMSVTGMFGQGVQEYCYLLLRRNLVQVIATDAHSSLERPPILSRALKEASAIIGETAANRLVKDNPRAIIEGRNFEVPEPISMVLRKRSWFQKILKL